MSTLLCIVLALLAVGFLGKCTVTIRVAARTRRTRQSRRRQLPSRTKKNR